MTPKQKIIIYQPWGSHTKIPNREISKISQQLDQANYTHLLVQWSRYGVNSYWESPEKNWFSQQIKHSNQRLIEGLYADPNFYQALNLADPDLINFLSQIREKSLNEARGLMKQTAFRITAWYLPEEIDDLNWRSTARQKILSQHLKSTISALKQLDPKKPVFASTFFGGHTSPQEYANFLRQIHLETGIIWIVQDGQGVLRNPQPDTTQYLRAIKRTLPANSWLGLLENFTELNQNTDNRFCPATNEEIETRRKVWCSATGNEPDAYFSLNQLNNDLLGHKNTKCKTRIGNIAPN